MSSVADDVKPCNLPEILLRAEAATEGPWISSGGVDNAGAHCEYINTPHYSAATEFDVEDARFAAAARTDVPAMAAEIAALRAGLGEALEMVENLDDEESPHPCALVARLRALLPTS